MEDLRFFFSKPVSVFVNYLKWVSYKRNRTSCNYKKNKIKNKNWKKKKSSLTAFLVNTSFRILVAQNACSVPLSEVELRADGEGRLECLSNLVCFCRFLLPCNQNTWKTFKQLPLCSSTTKNMDFRTEKDKKSWIWKHHLRGEVLTEVTEAFITESLTGNYRDKQDSPDRTLRSKKTKQKKKT